MGNEKTDPNGLAALASKPVTVPMGLLLAVLGPLVGMLGARQMDDRDAKIDKLTMQVVELRSDVTRLADTIGEVRKIEEAAHPRVGVPRSQPDQP